VAHQREPAGLLFRSPSAGWSRSDWRSRS